MTHISLFYSCLGPNDRLTGASEAFSRARARRADSIPGIGSSCLERCAEAVRASRPTTAHTKTNQSWRTASTHVCEAAL